MAANPYLDAEPGSGGPGAAVVARGGGFPANQAIDIYLAGVAQENLAAAAAPQPVASARSDGSGNFVASFVMPARWPDGRTIPNGKLVILAATPDFGVEATDTFNFFTSRPNPSVTINPSSGGAGTTVTASGGGFPANVEVGVYLSALDAQVGGGEPYRYAVTMTDYNGRYSMSFAMPAFWPDGSPVAQSKLVVTVANQDLEHCCQRSLPLCFTRTYGHTYPDRDANQHTGCVANADAQPSGPGESTQRRAGNFRDGDRGWVPSKRHALRQSGAHRQQRGFRPGVCPVCHDHE